MSTDFNLTESSGLCEVTNAVDPTFKNVASDHTVMSPDESSTNGNITLLSCDQPTTSESALSCDQSSSNDIDPYAYTKLDDFTSEIFKIEIGNLPKRVGFVQLKKKLLSLGLLPCKMKSMEYAHIMFVTFRSEDDRQKALGVLDGHTWKNRQLTVKKASPVADPLTKKRKHDAEQRDEEKKKKVVEKVSQTEENIVENQQINVLSEADRLNDSVTPLWKVPYDDQVKKKFAEMKDCLEKLTRNIVKNNLFLESFTLSTDSDSNENEGVCKLFPLKQSPVLRDYRNKCEFTIGKSLHGIDKTVGFRFGQYKGGVVNVGEPSNCINIPEHVKQAAKIFHEFFRNHSDRPSFDPELKSGNWRTLTIRSNCNCDIMAIAEFHPQKLTNDEILVEKNKLEEYVKNCGGTIRIVSVYLEIKDNRLSQTKEDVSKMEHVFGEKFIEEKLLDMTFRISPLAFFQVNTPAAEVLYEVVRNWSHMTNDTLLLDICCGTGTIGLTMAKFVKKVVGFEMCQEAVEDAKANAQLNGITNAGFYCGLAEKTLPSVLWCLIGQEGVNQVVAVVDPPRAGLHADVIRTIRKCAIIKRLVYVSCNPTGSMQNNIIDLTRSESKRVKGAEFRLSQAIPIDMFPHTSHCELVLLLQR